MTNTEKPKQFSDEEKEKLAKEEGVTPEFYEAVKKGWIPPVRRDYREVLKKAKEELPDKPKPWAKDWPETPEKKTFEENKIIRELYGTISLLEQNIKELTIYYNELVREHPEFMSRDFQDVLKAITEKIESLEEEYNNTPDIQSDETKRAEILIEVKKTLGIQVFRYQEEIDRIKNQLKKER